MSHFHHKRLRDPNYWKITIVITVVLLLVKFIAKI